MRQRRSSTVALVALATLFALAMIVSCGGSASSCPPEGTSLTYRGFAKTLLDEHCVRCHGGADTFGGVSLRTLSEVRTHAERVAANAADGNTTMPPGGAGPTMEERRALGEWLACGAP